MVDKISQADWERLDREREANNLESQTEILDWLTYWDVGPHRIRWGKDRKGRQRYKWVDGKPPKRGTQELAEELTKQLILKDRLIGQLNLENCLQIQILKLSR